ncbi:hypothetical protein Angca_005477, partial [Angiostrongylus cantonensis]
DSFEVHFCVKKTAAKRKVKTSFINRSSVGLSSLRFLCESGRIYDDYTANTLHMEDNDVIEV